MKKTLLLISLFYVYSTNGFIAAEERLITSDEFISELGGSSHTQEETFKTRGYGEDGRVLERKIAVQQKQIAIHINFKYNSTELADEWSQRQLEQAGIALSSSRLSYIKVEIGGHTDGIGSREYNLSLSERRAKRIMKDLMDIYGITAERLIAHGYGKDFPVASNDTDNGRAQNRRVVIRRLK